MLEGSAVPDIFFMFQFLVSVFVSRGLLASTHNTSTTAPGRCLIASPNRELLGQQITHDKERGKSPFHPNIRRRPTHHVLLCVSLQSSLEQHVHGTLLAHTQIVVSWGTHLPTSS